MKKFKVQIEFTVTSLEPLSQERATKLLRDEWNLSGGRGPANWYDYKQDRNVAVKMSRIDVRIREVRS